MPVSSYSFFHSLSQIYYKKHHPELFNQLDSVSQSKISSMKRLTDKVFEPYHLFAFIIHDPEEHHEFAMNLSRDFYNYHKKTGDKLLFFALTQPPDQWNEKDWQPAYFQHLQKVFHEEKNLYPYYHQKLNNLFDDSFHVGAIAKALKIPYDQLPAIVITAHPSLSSFQWYRTSTTHIKKQLKELAIVANDLNDYRRNPSFHLLDVQNQLFTLLKTEYEDEINLCGAEGNELLKESLATALSELLSFLINRKESNGQFNEMANSQVEVAMVRVIEAIKVTKLKLTKDNENQAVSDELDDLCEKIGTFISLMHQPIKEEIDEEIPEFELDSNQLYKMGLNLGEYIERYRGRYPDLDFTAAAICLAKAFELEINKSVVH